jgi:hypothetical protein
VSATARESKPPETSVSATVHPASGLLRRMCACGGTPGADGECAACRARRLQRRAGGGRSIVAKAPPLVHDVLASPSEPLAASVQAFMKPRFGHDFADVRVHHDARAAESARAVGALAYTVGRDVVFGAGRYAPESREGRLLLAHELAHVVQQAGAGPAPAALEIGDPASGAEREAEQAARKALSRTGAAGAGLTMETRPTIRRWRIGGNTATSDHDSDTLSGLAVRAGAHFNDWKCIKPISQRTSTHARPPANFDARYELYVQIGDTFDISNLTATTGPTLRIYLFDDASEAMNANLVKLFYPGATSSATPDNDIENAASSGSTPIADFLIFSHAGGDTMWGNASSFTPRNFDPEQDTQTFALAHAGLFPRRCWFTRNATARSVGCDSEHWGTDFASHYLRVGASITTTTKSVRPKCTAPLMTPAGGCLSYDGVDFATSFTVGATSLDGPFWSAAAFHAGRFWKTIRGRL